MQRTRRYQARLISSVAAGVIVAIVTLLFGGARWSGSAGWAAACAVFVIGALPLLRLDADKTRTLATREDPRRTISDLLLVCAALASVVALVVLLAGAKTLSGTERDVVAALGAVSVALSWGLVQTLFVLRYAELYYNGTPGGIDFNQDEPPQYSDFAYFGVTVGMTYQVSDTNIRSSRIRATTLRHALLSFFFGTVVIASVVNLVAGLQ